MDNELADLQTRWNSRSKEEEKKYGGDEENQNTIVWPWETAHWKEVERVLNTHIQTPEELESHLTALSHSKSAIKFFSSFFQDEEGQKEKTHFFSTLLPFIQKLALKLPLLFKNVPVPVLLPGETKTVTFNKEQVGSLIASAFFSTFEKYLPVSSSKYRFSDFSLSELFIDESSKFSVLCLLNYFKRLSQEIPKGNLVIQRVNLSDDQRPKWDVSTLQLKDINFVLGSSIIESKAEVHIDFANKLIGGGVLSGATLDEEVLFLMKPECLVTMLLSAELEENEAILISGAEQFSKCEGSGFNFKFIGDFKDPSPRDEKGTIKRTIIAIDPVLGAAAKGSEQFQDKLFIRDVNKLYLGFSATKDTSVVATGLWGCGPMSGDKKLKLFQQALAAAQANKNLEYHLDNKKDEKAFSEFLVELRKHSPTVGTLIKNYISILKASPEFDTQQFFQNILNKF